MVEYINEIKNENDINLDCDSITKIREQKKQCICKMIGDNENYGTGFLCKIYLDNLMKKVLITHISLQFKNQEIDLKNSFNKNISGIKCEDRLIFKDAQNQIAFIEIKENDGIDDVRFLEIDLNIYDSNPNEYFKDKNIYSFYQSDTSIVQCFGKIKEIDTKNNNIIHLCSSPKGSLGGPIINLETKKVIGMNKGSDKNKIYNLATFLNIPIQFFRDFCETKSMNKSSTYSQLPTTEASLNLSCISNEEIKKNKRPLTNKRSIIVSFVVDDGTKYSIKCSVELPFKDAIDLFYKESKLNKKKDMIFRFNEKNININETKTLKELNVKENKSIFVYYATIKNLNLSHK